MSDSSVAKCACPSCDTWLEFPLELLNTEISCPGCQQPVKLEAAVTPASNDSEPAFHGLDSATLVNAFQGTVPRTPLGIGYQIGLIAVTVAMVLLPVIYFCLIVAAGWAVYWWAVHFTFLVGGGGGPRVLIFKMVCYLAPMFAGLIVVLFMIKPLFARPAPRAQPLALNPNSEPLMFMFIRQICDAIRAPMPARIDVDCQLNASASFRRGFGSFLGNDLVLVIGLPLVAGLDLRQLAGVIAHEFGHFTQGFGMRLTYVIRRVNFWFLRVIHERDAWDAWLEEQAETESFAMILVVSCARLGVWFSRQVLKLLLLAGHVIGSFMLRQMEHDADSYEVKLVGSEVFEATFRRLHVLDAVSNRAYKEMQAKWGKSRELPDDFPAYLLQQDRGLPGEARTRLEDTMGLATSGPFDSHPSTGDRIRQARWMNRPGIFHLDAPATLLLANFEVLARQVTSLHYADDLGLPCEMTRLVPVHDRDQPLPPSGECDDATEARSPAVGGRIRLRVPRG